MPLLGEISFFALTCCHQNKLLFISDGATSAYQMTELWRSSGVRRNFSWGGFIQRHRV